MRKVKPSGELPLMSWGKTAIEAKSAVGREGLKVVGLFAGVGGVELGLERAGHKTVLLCEIEEGARAVLHARMPGIPVHDDVCTLSQLPEGTDLLTAGFPCQDLSQAGKTQGIEGSRSGLVGEVFRLIRANRVPWLVLENVPFMLRLSKGRAMEVIVASLEELGYRWAYRVVNSRAFGLPQRRERVVLVASLVDDPRDVLFADDFQPAAEPADPVGKVACGFYWTEGIRGLGWAVDAVPTLKGGSTIGIPSPPAIIFPDGLIATPDIRDAERMQGFPVDWTRPALEVSRPGHRWKLVGNAVSVDMAEWLGKRLRSPDPRGRTVDGVRLEKGSPWPTAAWNTGEGRCRAFVSAYPEARPQETLTRWLKHPPKPLSARATSGFLKRAEAGSLRFPKGFLDAIRAHLARVEQVSLLGAENAIL